MVGAKLHSDDRSAWRNDNEFLESAAKFLDISTDNVLKTDLHISNSEGPSIKFPILQELHDKIHPPEANLTTLEIYKKIKELIKQLEAKGYFNDRLEKLIENYDSGLIVKKEIIKRIKQSLPQFKYIIDEYDERECLEFYTDSIKGKTRVPIIEFHYGNENWIVILIGKGKMENEVLVPNPAKKAWNKYFYKNYPHYLYSNDIHSSLDANGNKVDQKIMGWKNKDLNIAFDELKKYINEST